MTLRAPDSPKKGHCLGEPLPEDYRKSTMPASSRACAAVLFVLLLGLAGCPSAPPSDSPGTTEKAPLRLLVVDDPEFGQAIARERHAGTEETLDVKDVSVSDLAHASRLPGDVIVFPSGLVGLLMERGLIVPLDDEPLAQPEFDRRDIFDQIRLREMTWGNRTVAVPLGSPQLLLAYRADIFEKLAISPPSDWSEYQTTLEKLADRAPLGDLAPPGDQPWRATVEPLADGWAGQLLLARAAAYAAHRDQISPLFRFDSGEPLIGQPPYSRALRELAAAARAGGFADARLSPDEAVSEVRAGRAAMALGWLAPDLAAKYDPGAASKGQIKFALLPGAKLSYNMATKRWDKLESEQPIRVPTLALAGRLAAVSSNSSSRKRSEGFALWLAGKEVGSQVGPQSRMTTLFRKSHIVQAERWTGGAGPIESKSYAEALQATLNLPQAFPGLRLPGRDEYLAALDQAVQKAVTEETPPAELLEQVASRWSEITASIGAQKQKQANLRSLGQEELPK
jgi:ABC-type glycerol-3-phosphate transport system substrate-binding protein